jgi:hypothetical protein
VHEWYDHVQSIHELASVDNGNTEKVRFTRIWAAWAEPLLDIGLGELDRLPAQRAQTNQKEPFFLDGSNWFLAFSLLWFGPNRGPAGSSRRLHIVPVAGSYWWASSRFVSISFALLLCHFHREVHSASLLLTLKQTHPYAFINWCFSVLVSISLYKLVFPEWLSDSNFTFWVAELMHCCCFHGETI